MVFWVKPVTDGSRYNPSYWGLKGNLSKKVLPGTKRALLREQAEETFMHLYFSECISLSLSAGRGPSWMQTDGRVLGGSWRAWM